jgi:uncharacterized protein YjbI with pentapeptide repeats
MHGTSFAGAQFRGQHCYFSRAAFLQDQGTSFKKVIFAAESVHFKHTEFKSVNFEEAMFIDDGCDKPSDSLPCKRCRSATTNLKKTCDNVAFNNAVFTGDVVSFKNVNFHQKYEIDFERARFRCENVYFDDASFKGKRTSFTDATFAHSQVFMRNVQFDSVTPTVVDGCDFGFCDFHGADLTTVKWTDNTRLDKCENLEHAFLLDAHKRVKEREERKFNFKEAYTIFANIAERTPGKNIADEKEMKNWRKTLHKRTHRFEHKVKHQESEYEMAVLKDLIAEPGIFFRSGCDHDVLISKIRIAALQVRDPSLHNLTDPSELHEKMQAYAQSVFLLRRELYPAAQDWETATIEPEEGIHVDIRKLREEESRLWDQLEIETKVEEYSFSLDDSNVMLTYPEFCETIFKISDEVFQQSAHNSPHGHDFKTDPKQEPSPTDPQVLEIGDWAIKKKTIDIIGHDSINTQSCKNPFTLASFGFKMKCFSNKELMRVPYFLTSFGWGGLIGGGIGAFAAHTAGGNWKAIALAGVITLLIVSLMADYMRAYIGAMMKGTDVLRTHKVQLNHVIGELQRLRVFQLTQDNWREYIDMWNGMYLYLDLLDAYYYPDEKATWRNLSKKEGKAIIRSKEKIKSQRFDTKSKVAQMHLIGSMDFWNQRLKENHHDVFHGQDFENVTTRDNFFEIFEKILAGGRKEAKLRAKVEGGKEVEKRLTAVVEGWDSKKKAVYHNRVARSSGSNLICVRGYYLIPRSNSISFSAPLLIASTLNPVAPLKAIFVLKELLHPSANGSNVHNDLDIGSKWEYGAHFMRSDFTLRSAAC